MDRFANYAATQDYLFSLKAKGVRYGIDRMNLWLAQIGHPEAAVPCIHVTGTNGKGSTAAMLEAMLRAAGWKTGLYTSPHLVRLGERVQVDRVPLSEREIMAYAQELKPIAEEASRTSPDDHPSFFEFMTAMAFLQFARKKCDISIIEVGLGGRLDATNVVQPEVSVITSIGLDHCDLLGDTIEKIAYEKAGIIKPGRPVVVGRVPPAAEAEIRRVAEQKASPVWSTRDSFGSRLDAYPRSALEGDYQRWNAGTAALTARVLEPRWRLTDDIVSCGLQSVQWPGRWQRMNLSGREVILDSSHNPEGAAMLDIQLTRLRAETGKAPIVVVGALGLNRARALLEVVSRHAKAIHFVRPDQSRACSFEELEAVVPLAETKRTARARVEDLFPTPQSCAIGEAGDCVIVTGSIYLIGEVLARIEPERGAGEGRLQDF